MGSRLAILEIFKKLVVEENAILPTVWTNLKISDKKEVKEEFSPYGVEVKTHNILLQIDALMQV